MPAAVAPQPTIPASTIATRNPSRAHSAAHAAHDALLPPDLPLVQFSIREKTCELGAGPCPTRRSIVSIAGTQNEVFAVDSGELRWCKQLDVIDLVPIASFNSGASKLIANATRKLHQLLEVLELQLLRVIVHEEKPVATPGDVARHWSKSRHVDRNILCEPVARHVCYFNLSGSVKMCDDNSDRSLDAMRAGTDATQISERRYHADRPVPAHAEVCNAVEEDHPGHTRIVDWRTQQSTNHRLRTTRFVYNSAAEVVM